MYQLILRPDFKLLLGNAYYIRHEFDKLSELEYCDGAVLCASCTEEFELLIECEVETKGVSCERNGCGRDAEYWVYTYMGEKKR